MTNKGELLGNNYERLAELLLMNVKVPCSSWKKTSIIAEYVFIGVTPGS